MKRKSLCPSPAETLRFPSFLCPPRRPPPAWHPAGESSGPRGAGQRLRPVSQSRAHLGSIPRSPPQHLGKRSADGRPKAEATNGAWPRRRWGEEAAAAASSEVIALPTIHRAWRLVTVKSGKGKSRGQSCPSGRRCGRRFIGLHWPSVCQTPASPRRFLLGPRSCPVGVGQLSLWPLLGAGTAPGHAGDGQEEAAHGGPASGVRAGVGAPPVTDQRPRRRNPLLAPRKGVRSWEESGPSGSPSSKRLAPTIPPGAEGRAPFSANLWPRCWAVTSLCPVPPPLPPFLVRQGHTSPPPAVWGALIVHQMPSQVSFLIAFNMDAQPLPDKGRGGAPRAVGPDFQARWAGQASGSRLLLAGHRCVPTAHAPVLAVGMPPAASSNTTGCGRGCRAGGRLTPAREPSGMQVGRDGACGVQPVSTLPSPGRLWPRD